jgi:hypothetical protein
VHESLYFVLTARVYTHSAREPALTTLTLLIVLMAFLTWCGVSYTLHRLELITRIRGSSNGRFKRPGDSSSQCRRLVVLGHARTLFPTPAQVIIHLKHSPQHLIARWCVETAQGSELWAIKLKVNTRSSPNPLTLLALILQTQCVKK